MMRWALILIGVTLWLMSSAAAALACGCCDFAISRKLVGWSKDGRSVLVRMSDDGACEHKFALEVWEVDSPQPTSCFDLVHGPDTQITCDQLQYASERPDKDGREGRPRRSLVPRRFPRAVKQLPASRVRVTRSQTPRAGDDGLGRDIDVVVAVKSDGKWHTVWDSAKASIEPIFMQNGGLPKVRIFPAPAGKVALLALSGHDRNHGNGTFPTELYWVTLP